MLWTKQLVFFKKNPLNSFDIGWKISFFFFILILAAGARDFFSSYFSCLQLSSLFNGQPVYLAGFFSLRKMALPTGREETWRKKRKLQIQRRFRRKKLQNCQTTAGTQFVILFSLFSLFECSITELAKPPVLAVHSSIIFCIFG